MAEKNCNILMVKQPTSVQGRLVLVELSEGPTVVGLEIDGARYDKITVDDAMCAQLASLFGQYVRLTGEGCWVREAGGRWELAYLGAEAFEVLQDHPIEDTIEKLRSFLPPEGADALAQAVYELRRE